jgi:hemerythrin-like domain-containing protein
MRLTDRLRVEHGIFLWQLRTLEEMQREGAYPETLRAVVEVLARAEDHHSQLEERVLFPALARVMGAEHEALRVVAADHERMREAAAHICGEDFGPEDIRLYVETAREHFEREIHGLFVLAEELLTDEELSKLANWNVDHAFESTGRPAPWAKA